MSPNVDDWRWDEPSIPRRPASNTSYWIERCRRELRASAVGCRASVDTQSGRLVQYDNGVTTEEIPLSSRNP